MGNTQEKNKSYSEMMKLKTFKERVEYLSIDYDYQSPRSKRSQEFYKSDLWKRTRKSIIARDLGNDLGFGGRDIHTKVIVHHIEPITIDDIISGNYKCIDPENLVTTSIETHNIIHYGLRDDLIYEERQPNDHILWR